ncbi:MAG: DNA-3-methyladenine glycosylase [Bacteroidetes bacterium GWA2_31_9]|nr:MAG: DNA-3-methyladenine glycosylase [Bacteroidetes bacterium GWA2_31_9]
MQRCNWTKTNELMIKYHDEEWGVPLHDDLKHFEFIVLDTFQAGLSWQIVLNKREGFRKAFDNFIPEKIVKFSETRILKLLEDSTIIKNKLKIHATINNAKAFLNICEKYGSFDKYIWQFVDGKTIINSWKELKELPPKTAISDKMSKDLIKHGFKFAGSTTCYAYMQAAGMVNDHFVSCFRYNEINQIINGK